MSHEIVDNMIAWKGEEPWHGLGYKVPDNATGLEMLKVAKLDWRVQRRQIAMRSADPTNPGLLKDQLSNFRAIVRSDNDFVFQVATEKYHPMQNHDIVDFFREYCEAGNARMETVGGLKGGAIVWALAKLVDAKSDVELGGVDKLQGYILIATGHDGKLQNIVKATDVRVVCWNTLSSALGLYGGKLGKKAEREFRWKHSRKFTPELAAEAKQTIGILVNNIQATHELAGKLSQVSLDGKGKMEFLRMLLNKDKGLPVVAPETAIDEPTQEEIDRVVAGYLEPEVKEAELDSLGRVGKSILDAIYTSPGAQLSTAEGTLWGAINGVSYYTDHLRSRTQDNRLTNAWFGAGDDLKNKAVEVAVELAGFSL